MSGRASDKAYPDRAKPAVFLKAGSYRRRRLLDASRLLPIVGAALFLIPLLWPSADDAPSGEAVSMSRAIGYIFGIWAGLILCTALFGLATRSGAGKSVEHSTGDSR